MLQFYYKKYKTGFIVSQYIYLYKTLTYYLYIMHKKTPRRTGEPSETVVRKLSRVYRAA